MTPERLAELDAAFAKQAGTPFGENWIHLNTAAKHHIFAAYPDLRAHIEAQAATIARLERALHKVDKLLDVGNALSFAAQTTGGIAGRDESLVAAIDAWTAAARKGAA